MNLHTHRMAWMCWSVGLSLAVAAQAATTTQPAASSQPAAKAGSGVGYVKGNNVYIRSGFSTNYYPVTKLNSGDELKITGEEFGWLKVVPPAGTFSLVDKSYVDKVADKKGVINGTATVYAGSNIDDRRYAKQVKLNKGDNVQIIGETSDGAFYKIEPPAGTHLWIKADLVDRTGAVTPNRPGLETVPPGGLGLADSGAKATGKPAGSRSKAAAGATASIEKKVNEPSADIGEKYLLEINSIEAEIQAESTKPLAERQFGPIITRLEPIAAQSEDEVSQLYATTRIDQLRGHTELAGAVKELRGLTEKAIDDADVIARERANLRTKEAKPMDDIALRGEIRVSSIYSGSGILPKRWRIVDPQTNRTQAYIEVPEGSDIDPAQYYGKYVGIRATGYRILRESVQPLPIYTVKEIVLQDKSQQGNMPGAGFIASPPNSVPLIVAQPSSQPAAAEKTAEPGATTQPE